MVMRDGIAKAHIVMCGNIAHCLISDKESEWRLGYHTVIGQLANAASLQIIEEALPGISGSKLGDDYAAFLYPYVDVAWDGYFSARVSATFYPEAEEGYCELLISALDTAKTDILSARYDYRFHGDLDRLLGIVFPRIRNVLHFAGRLLGHYDGLGKELLENQQLARKLEEMGLVNWFVLFDSELSELASRRGRWASFDEFLHLNRHVERLLWQFGFIPWKTDEGQLRVEVPIGTDAHRLMGIRPRLRLALATIFGKLRKVVASLAPLRHLAA